MSCVISREVEFSEPLILTIETLTTHWKYYVQSHAEYFQTGEQLDKKTVMFRGDLKDRLMCVTVNGFGISLAETGLPNVNMIRAAHFAAPLAPAEYAQYASSMDIDLDVMVVGDHQIV